MALRILERNTRITESAGTPIRLCKYLQRMNNGPQSKGSITEILVFAP